MKNSRIEEKRKERNARRKLRNQAKKMKVISSPRETKRDTGFYNEARHLGFLEIRKRNNKPILYIDQNGTEVLLNVEKKIALGQNYKNPYYQAEIDRILRFKTGTGLQKSVETVEKTSQ